MNRSIVCAVAVVACLSLCPRADAAGARVLKEAAEQALKRVGRKGAREIAEIGGREVVEELAKLGGREAAEELLERAAHEGGEELVEKVFRVARRAGRHSFPVLAKAPRRLARMLDGLSDDLLERGVAALRRDGDRIIRYAERYGDEVLESAARHPGVGLEAIETFGSEGVRLGRQLTTDQLAHVVRHADDLHRLAPAARVSKLREVANAPRRVVEILAEHPVAVGVGVGVGVGIPVAADNLTEPTVTETTTPDGTTVRRTQSATGRVSEEAGSWVRLALTAVGLIGTLALAVAAWKVVGAAWGVVAASTRMKRTDAQPRSVSDAPTSPRTRRRVRTEGEHDER